VLTLSVSEGKNDVEGESYLRREFANGPFERHFVLSEMVDANKIDATYHDGILTIYIAKKEEAKPQKPRTISIS
jgi:HSP20 family protein